MLMIIDLRTLYWGIEYMSMRRDGYECIFVISKLLTQFF